MARAGCLHLGEWVSHVVTAENQLPDTYCGDCGAVVISHGNTTKELL